MVLFILSSHGKGSRIFSSNIVTIGEGRPEIAVVEEQWQVYDIWKSRGLHGRVVVHFDNVLDIKPLSGKNMDIVFGYYPGKLETLVNGPEKALGSENFILFAVADDIARKVVGVVPDTKLREIDNALRMSGYMKYSGYYRGFFLNGGVPKLITTAKKLPSFNEPVLMDFDANFFSSSDVSPREVFDDLKRLRIKTDLVTVSMSRGDKDVSPEGIEKMKVFVELLRGT